MYIPSLWFPSGLDDRSNHLKRNSGTTLNSLFVIVFSFLMVIRRGHRAIINVLKNWRLNFVEWDQKFARLDVFTFSNHISVYKIVRFK